MKVDLVFLIIIYDLFVNLAAGWFGAAFIVPLTSKTVQTKWLLFVNISLGIISLLVGYIFGKLGGL